MKTRFILLPTALTLLGACVSTVDTAQTDGPQFIAELPEAVRERAAPYQNLNEVQLRAEDGCYWYRHVGPVETTFLPLKSVDGRPICTRLPDAPAEPL